MADPFGNTASSGGPVGYEQAYAQSQAPQPGGLPQGGGYSSAAAVSQLFARLSQEIEEKHPNNCIHFVVDFLCKHYPEHLHGFASIWQMDPDLERERHEVVNFFKAHKISTAVAAHFTNAGYDTLDTLTTLTADGLVDVEAFNNVKWLPGHKVRLQQIFGEISARVRAYRQQTEPGQRAQSPPHGRPHGHHHHHHSHQASAHTAAASSHQAVGHHASALGPMHQHAPALTTSPAHQASPYLAAAHAAAAAAVAVPASTAVYHQPALSVPTAISAGIGHGVAPPALPAAGGLFYQGAFSAT